MVCRCLRSTSIASRHGIAMMFRPRPCQATLRSCRWCRSSWLRVRNAQRAARQVAGGTGRRAAHCRIRRFRCGNPDAADRRARSGIANARPGRGYAHLCGYRRNRHASWLRWSPWPGRRSSAARPLEWPSISLFQQATRSDEDSLSSIYVDLPVMWSPCISCPSAKAVTKTDVHIHNIRGDT